MELTEVIRRGIITEKAVDMQSLDHNQKRRLRHKTLPPKKEEDMTHRYVFEVALTANKIEIRKAVEALFPDVTVLAVNTMRMPGKRRAIRTQRGVKYSEARPWKKAIVTVRMSESIIQLQP
jgi:large subunit ribosomal protein L23